MNLSNLENGVNTTTNENAPSASITIKFKFMDYIHINSNISFVSGDININPVQSFKKYQSCINKVNNDLNKIIEMFSENPNCKIIDIDEDISGVYVTGDKMSLQKFIDEDLAVLVSDDDTDSSKILDILSDDLNELDDADYPVFEDDTTQLDLETNETRKTYMKNIINMPSEDSQSDDDNLDSDDCLIETSFMNKNQLLNQISSIKCTDSDDDNNNEGLSDN
jgi:hypothetical protein